MNRSKKLDNCHTQDLEHTFDFTKMKTEDETLRF